MASATHFNKYLFHLFFSTNKMSVQRLRVMALYFVDLGDISSLCEYSGLTLCSYAIINKPWTPGND